MNKHYQQWDELAPRGLMLIAAGLSVIGQAIIVKSKGKGFLRWFIYGLIGLSLFNAGIAMFGEAVKNRTLYEIDIKALREKSNESE